MQNITHNAARLVCVNVLALNFYSVFQISYLTRFIGVYVICSLFLHRFPKSLSDTLYGKSNGHNVFLPLFAQSDNTTPELLRNDAMRLVLNGRPLSAVGREPHNLVPVIHQNGYRAVRALPTRDTRTAINEMSLTHDVSFILPNPLIRSKPLPEHISHKERISGHDSNRIKACLP